VIGERSLRLRSELDASKVGPGMQVGRHGLAYLVPSSIIYAIVSVDGVHAVWDPLFRELSHLSHGCTPIGDGGGVPVRKSPVGQKPERVVYAGG